jgi:hypothetical protein
MMVGGGWWVVGGGRGCSAKLNTPTPYSEVRRCARGLHPLALYLGNSIGVGGMVGEIYLSVYTTWPVLSTTRYPSAVSTNL